MKKSTRIALLTTIVLTLLTIYNLSGVSFPAGKERFQKSQAYLTESSRQFNLPGFSINNAELCATTYNNKVLVLNDTVSAYEKMIFEMEAANTSINIETFILRDDATGRRLKETLIKKAGQGVRVRLIYDSVGSFFTPARFFRDMENQGVKVTAFNPVFSGWAQGRLDNRMHSKIMVIDGTRAIIGGQNFSNEYLGLDPKIGYWKGLNVLLEGSAVNSIQQVFFKDWYMAGGEKIMDKSEYPMLSETSNQKISVVWGGPDSPLTDMSGLYSRLADSADRNIYIETPYFLPDNDLLGSLQRASRRGVDVHLIIPAHSDHRIDELARAYYLEKILQQGIKVSTYKQGYLHSKLMIVDSRIAAVGSANLDKRSGSKNYETDVVIYDNEVAVQLEDGFNNDLMYSSTLSNQMLKVNIFEKILRKAAAILLNIV